MLCDPKCPAELCLLGTSVSVSQILDRGSWHTSDSFGVLEGIRFDRRAVLIEPGRRMLDKIAVNESLDDNFPRYSVG